MEVILFLLVYLSIMTINSIVYNEETNNNTNNNLLGV